MVKKIDKLALEYHRSRPPGKIAIMPTKPLATQRDLALAYSPGVAAACHAIVGDETQVAELTARSNLVAVITNGSAVLGLGNIGPLAAKPVMEGKGVLFKKFSGIDVFDLEINEKDPDKLVEIIASLEPSFGGINLEDIKAPECFLVEGKLRKRLNIPVFHDDQHGTAIIVAAAIFNGLEIVGKSMEQVRVVTLGAGAAAQGCLNILISMGFPRENLIMLDREGVIYKNRPRLSDPHKKKFAIQTDCRTLEDAMKGADIFLGLSGPGLVTQNMIRSMADQPMVFALANPVPEIMPEKVKKVRPDALVATGRSDYPNQVNNVLCFPYIFRGALDVSATEINDEMKLACARAIAALAREGGSDTVKQAYADSSFDLGPDYLIPRPFDPRLSVEVSIAAARAAVDSGVARRPIHDWRAYREKLTQMIFRSGMFMKPFFDKASNNPKRVVYTEGENETVLHAVQDVVDEGLAKPVLIGRRDEIEHMVRKLHLHIMVSEQLEIVEPTGDSRAVQALEMLRDRKVDAAISGVEGNQNRNMELARDIIGLNDGVKNLGFLNVLILNRGTYFLANTYEADPNAEQIAEIAMLAARHVCSLGVLPRMALLSHSTRGSSDFASARKMQEATRIVEAQHPDFEFEGEIQADTALTSQVRSSRMPDSRLTASANLLIMPDRDASNIAFNMVKVLGNGVAVGPILLGMRQPVYVVSPTATVRRIVNLSALGSYEAQLLESKEGPACRDTGS